MIKRDKQKMLASFYSPGDGFEPPLEEPESSVLPLDDPGLLPSENNPIINQIQDTGKKIFTKQNALYISTFSFYI